MKYAHYLKKTFSAILFAVISFIAYVAFLPADFFVFHEVRVVASAKKIFPYINEPQKISLWNPWKELFPRLRVSYFEDKGGVGSQAVWILGQGLIRGSANIIESEINDSVKIRIDFESPLKFTQEAEIILQQTYDDTLVAFIIQSPKSFLGKIVCVWMDIEKRTSGRFGKGLQNLKSIVEKGGGVI